MKKMMLLLSFGFGGAESRILKVANNILTDSDKIIVNPEFLTKAKTRTDLFQAIESLEERGVVQYTPKVPVFLIGKFYLHHIWVLFFSFFFIIKFKPKLFHSVLGGILLTPLAKLIGAKTVVELTSPDNVDFVSKFSFFGIKFTDKFLSVSRSVSERMMAKNGNHVNVSTYPTPYYEERNETLSSLKKEGNKIIITFCARLIPRKNGLLFAKAIKIFLSENTEKNIEVFILGDGPENEKIRQVLKNEEIQGKIFIGRVPEPYKVLKKSNIFVSLIAPDNYPSQSVLEAMDAENALLLSNTGYSSEFIGLDNGLLTELDAKIISYDLGKMIKDKEKLTIMGSNSKKWLTRRFSKLEFEKHVLNVHSCLMNE